MARSLRVHELCDQLALHGVSVEGTKATLVARLTACWSTGGGDETAPKRAKPTSPTQLDGRVLVAALGYLPTFGEYSIASYDAVSRSWKAAVRTVFRTTPIDADCLAVREHLVLPFLRYLVAAGAKLGSLRFGCGESETMALQWLLSGCDASDIQTVEIKLHRQSTFLFCRVLSEGIVDLAGADEAGETIAQNLHGIRELCSNVASSNDSSGASLQETLTTFCGSAWRLRLTNSSDDQRQSSGGTGHQIPALPRLTELHYHIAAASSHVRAQCMARLSASVAALPCLQTLHLTGGYGAHVNLSLQSATLLTLDLSRAEKGMWIDRDIACPNLMAISCRSGPYGTGIRPLTRHNRDNLDSWMDIAGTAPGGYVVGENCEGMCMQAANRAGGRQGVGDAWHIISGRQGLRITLD